MPDERSQFCKNTKVSEGWCWARSAQSTWHPLFVHEQGGDAELRVWSDDLTPILGPVERGNVSHRFRMEATVRVKDLPFEWGGSVPPPCGEKMKDHQMKDRELKELRERAYGLATTNMSPDDAADYMQIVSACVQMERRRAFEVNFLQSHREHSEAKIKDREAQEAFDKALSTPPEKPEVGG